jgi:hypothetical protein
MYQECRHIKTSGTKCGAPALKGKAYCYFHFRAHRLRHRGTTDRMEAFMNPRFKVAPLEDRGAIQAALSETVHALAQDHIDHKRAGRILWGLHLAITNLKAPGEIVATEPVRAVFHNEEGEEIGPEQIGYDESDELLENDGDELPRNEENKLPDDKAHEPAKDESPGPPQDHDRPYEDEVKADQNDEIGLEADTNFHEERTDENDSGAKNTKPVQNNNDRPNQKQKALKETPNQKLTKLLRQTIADHIADMRQKQPELYAKMVKQLLSPHVSTGG